MTQHKTRPTAKRGSRMNWVPITFKVPPTLARRIDTASRRAGRNRSEQIYFVLCGFCSQPYQAPEMPGA